MFFHNHRSLTLLAVLVGGVTMASFSRLTKGEDLEPHYLQ
jgi:hypothetical protein